MFITLSLVFVASCWLVAAKPEVSDQDFDCLSLMPIGVAGEPEKRPSPFEIIVKKETFKKDERITVELRAKRGGAKFKSFFVQTRRIDKSLNIRESIGTWSSPDASIAEKTCRTAFADSMVSLTSRPLSNVSLNWKAPSRNEGYLQIRATFVDEQNQFWLGERSRDIRDVAERRKTIKPKYKPPPPIEPIHTDVCGTKKGCYREPAGCWEKDCQYILTWVDFGDQVEFEISAAHDGNEGRWVAAALSHDTYMGDDSVMECVQNANTGSVGVFLSHVPPGSKYTERLPNNKEDIEFEEGSYYHGRLRCRFKRAKYLRSRKGVHPLMGASYHLLMALGYSSGDNIHRHEIVIGKYPVASPNKIDFSTHGNSGGRARYPLVKAHACLMLFAWIFCGTIGLLMVKYYKTMWPNSDFYGEKYWFTVHRSCMVTLVIAVIIAFILIFVEANGYSQLPELPGRAHPILGIIVTVCIVINPILALLRPSEGHRCRPVFNWFHFFFGLIANVLAVVNIFIGMEFGKANVPWWATWIVMLFFLFNLIVEVTLEVHQCWTHKKNKERMKKWELEKKEYPKVYHPKPHPAGHRFKRNMLFTHVIVTSIVTIILVITFAVC